MREQLSKLLGLADVHGRNDEIRHLSLEKIKENPFQPRTVFDDDSLKELADSIRAYGVIQPILVRRVGENYELVAGERRLRAAKIANLTTIPAVVRHFSDEEMALLALVENLQRRDLNFIEEAEGYRKLIKEFGFTQEELARRLGKSQASVANKLRILQLPPDILAKIAERQISERHARALLRLKDASEQMEVLNKIMDEGLTVQETEKLVESRMQNISREIIPLQSNSKKCKKTGLLADDKRKITKVIKDVRIYLNSIDQILSEMQKSGLYTEKTQEISEDKVDIHISVYLHRRKKETAGG